MEEQLQVSKIFITTVVSTAIIGTLLLMLLTIGCASAPQIETLDADEAYRYLEKQYNEEHYFEAVEGFSFYTLNHSGSALVDSAQFLLGMSHFYMKDYLLAANAFDELNRRFPSSSLVPESMYLIGECYWKMSPKYYLDQEYARRAINNLQAFIDYFPEITDHVNQAQELIGKCRTKLAHKTYANGIIYLKMKDYQAAVIYFQTVAEEFYDTEWAPKAVYQLGVALTRNEEENDAIGIYRTFLLRYPDHPWHNRVQVALDELTVQQ
ncbi:MAG: outer membrane protein assembly factor BamD [Candidatus Electryoneaceae bacterium]|nr:outer membrane protein assembly factor BamD [Candidatus Electryoneaceae bacterium]